MQPNYGVTPCGLQLEDHAPRSGTLDATVVQDHDLLFEMRSIESSSLPWMISNSLTIRETNHLWTFVEKKGCDKQSYRESQDSEKKI